MELLVLHSYPFDRPDAAQRATSLEDFYLDGSAHAILNNRTEQWDIVITAKHLEELARLHFLRNGSGAHVGCSSQARKSAKATIRSLIYLLGTAADQSDYKPEDLEGLS